MQSPGNPYPRMVHEPPTGDRLPPQNLDCERGVIGGVLMDAKAYDAVAEFLTPEDFYRDSHETIWRHIAALRSAGINADFLSLSESLVRAGVYDKVGGIEALVEIQNSVPHAAQTTYYARIVQEKSISRQVCEAGHEMLREAYSNTLTADELLAGAEARIMEIGRRGMGARPATGAELAAAGVEALDRLRMGQPSGVSTDLIDLDDMLGGSMADGELIIVAARPSVGKTALGLRICESAVFGQGTPTLFVSLEMSRTSIALRMFSGMGGIPGGRLKSHRGLNDDDGRSVARVVDALSASAFYVDDPSVRSMAAISALGRRYASAHKIGLMVIDYLQIVDGTGEGDARRSRQETVARMSAQLKALARQLRIPVVALCQLNRLVEARADKTPLLSDLRESGAIENDADVVMLLHRPDYYDPTDRPGEADLIVAKNRNGATGTVQLKFQKELARFDNLPPTHTARDF